jgi:hypothetical protein
MAKGRGSRALEVEPDTAGVTATESFIGNDMLATLHSRNPLDDRSVILYTDALDYSTDLNQLSCLSLNFHHRNSCNVRVAWEPVRVYQS